MKLDNKQCILKRLIDVKMRFQHALQSLRRTWQDTINYKFIGKLQHHNLKEKETQLQFA